MHFIEKYGILAVRIPSKFELLRFCKATGATARATFGGCRWSLLGPARLAGVAVRARLESDCRRGSLW